MCYVNCESSHCSLTVSCRPSVTQPSDWCKIHVPCGSNAAIELWNWPHTNYTTHSAALTVVIEAAPVSFVSEVQNMWDKLHVAGFCIPADVIFKTSARLIANCLVSETEWHGHRTVTHCHTQAHDSTPTGWVQIQINHRSPLQIPCNMDKLTLKSNWVKIKLIKSSLSSALRPPLWVTTIAF